MTKICFNWIWSWLISLVFRFSSSLPGQFSHHHSAGSTIWPESSSEIYQKTSQLPWLIFAISNHSYLSFSPRYVKKSKSKSWKTLVKTEDEKKIQMEDYRVLLEKLVKTKMQSESEAHATDDFKDLRKDIRNELSELKSMMTGCSSCSNNLKAKDLPKVWGNDKQYSSAWVYKTMQNDGNCQMRPRKY